LRKAEPTPDRYFGFGPGGPPGIPGGGMTGVELGSGTGAGFTISGSTPGAGLITPPVASNLSLRFFLVSPCVPCGRNSSGRDKSFSGIVWLPAGSPGAVWANAPGPPNPNNPVKTSGNTAFINHLHWKLGAINAEDGCFVPFRLNIAPATCVGVCNKILEAMPTAFAGLDAMTNEQLLESLKPSIATVDAVRVALQSQVDVLRKREVSWRAIGDALGISRQAPWERFFQSGNA
jgi:hypothetical protein